MPYRHGDDCTDSMMGIQTARHIVLHFVWTISVAALCFQVGSGLFHVVLLFNAGLAALIAAMRGDSWRARQITLWDEAVALVGVCTLTGLWR